MSKIPNTFSSTSQETIAGYSVELLPRSEINTTRWDKCIENALNETPLAYSWVLDHLTPGWHGLIIGNYEGVMPVRISSTFGFRLIQMPYDIHNLDLFSSLPQLSELKHSVFKHPLFQNYRFISYSFLPKASETSFENPKDRFLSFRNNYELSLNADYQTIFASFSKAHRKNVRRFLKQNLTIEKNTNTSIYKKLQQKKAKDKPALFTPKSHNTNFSQMVQTAINKNRGELITTSINGKIAGACFFLYGKKRIILFHITNTAGRKNYVTFGLINHFLQRNSNQNKRLDFAGSDIKDVASFNKGFGADHFTYPVYLRNSFPSLLKMAKKANLSYKLKRLASNLNK